jgi:phospholipase C
MVLARFQRMLGSFVGDAAQKYFKSRRCRVSVFDHPITRSSDLSRPAVDHPPALRCAEVITRLALLAASLFMIFLGGCAMGPSAPTTTTTTNSTQGLTSINHIIFIAQENRSFDTYFGHLNDYRAKQGLPADVDGMPAAAANPADDGSMVTPFHLLTMCIENTSAAWATSHINFNRFSLSSNTPTLDGFVVEGAAATKSSGGNDTKGVRVMGFYNDIDLISHYFLATQFGTSDRWFAPAPIETEPNRMYLVAATSVGHAHAPANQVNATTIFDLLDQKGISWKIYLVNPNIPSELGFFAGFVQKNQSKFVPIAQYNTDLQNGTLPSVAYIDRAPGVDEHPGSGASIQVGANFVTGLITSLMGSQYWKDSVFIVTFDEHGGLYDHVSPRVNGQAIQVTMGPSAGQPATQGPYASDSNSQQVPSPDGIPPQDLFTTNPPDPPGDFDRSGFRVPLLVVSPFSKKNFVSHTPADSTAILKFIETRFGLSNLTKRDAAQIDMTEFFDFQNVPWKTPPTVPTQPTNGPCTNTLP